MTRVILNFRSGFAGLQEGFEALGHEVLQDQWAPEAAGLTGVVACVVDFVECARQLRRTLGLKRSLARAGVPLIALNRDAPWHRGIHAARLAGIAWLAAFDGYATHSMQGAERFSRRTLYCPNGARDGIYRVSEAELAAMRDAAFFRWDVSFVGNLDAARYPEHARRVNFLRALGERLAWHGVRTFFRDAAGLAGPEQVEIIKRSRINLSVAAACDAGPEPSWGLPERCYGAPACGGFLLSDRRRHAAQDFAPEEWADYDGLEDCVTRIRDFLAAAARARAIAERARARVERDHRYKARAARLLDFARHAR